MGNRRTWRRHLPYAEWPVIDRSAWDEAIRKGDILDGRGPAAHWASATKRTNCQHYSRWLGFLAHHDLLESDTRPGDRLTNPAIKAYVEHLRSVVAPRTVVSSLVGLKVMMKAMVPDVDWRWLTDVCNALNRNCLRTQRECACARQGRSTPSPSRSSTACWRRR